MDSVLPFLLGVLVIVLGLAVSIALHEIGHLVPAKLFGVKVTQYMIGFGPTLWSKRRGETEYGVKAIPLGGYISMIGMFPPAKGEQVHADSTGFFKGLVQDARDSSQESITPGDEQRAFYLLPVWKRIIIMFGGPFMNLVLAVVLFGVLLMGFGVPQSTTTVASVSACVLPATSERQTCEPGDPAAPGAEAGLKPGDTLVSIDGEPVTSWEQSTAIIRANPGEDLAVVVERDGAEQTLTVTPALSERYVVGDDGKVVTDAAGEPVTVDVGFVGIGPTGARVQQPVTAVLPAVGENIAGVAGIVVNLPQRMVDVANAAFGPAERDPNGPLSVVGVGRVAGEVAASDQIASVDKVAGLIGILGSLNIALFVFNLIPLLPLDGGHIAGALFEGIRRAFAKLFRRPDPGPVDMAKLMPLTLGVVIVLGAMSALLIYADLVKPVQLF
ncbi:membrane-associated protease RseP (regulator of RpoE activity) [Agromyces terreus]|uniref:Membrane-associated protease RseP (Regulator of RpoE activity) n=1 Tax=Agromyces terreus TaxID=424795 RepID=A0A9X2H1V7_9MICO|nr:site-2 protease family protein [Agromyces terreus]MCP2371458.1 membrane-associated protease RseP (regulator of RpoE activity) [Agromyces terreus]